MRYDTVVYSASEGDIGNPARLEKHWITIRELPVASCTRDQKKIAFRLNRVKTGTSTARVPL